jgi:predicted dehydrogenase
MATQFRYGMVGGSIYDFIGDVHRKAIQFDPRVQLVAGCFSRDAKKNADTADAFHVEPGRTYETYQQMAKAEAGRLDFVSITTPNVIHYEVAKAFLEAGINVFCEKPLCFEIAQAQELRALAQEKGLLFGVMYSHTGNVMVRVAKQMIARGDIGQVISVNAEYVQEWLLDKLSPTESDTGTSLSGWRADPAVAGISNCVGDIGSHIENMIHFLTGLKIKRLLASVNRFGQPLELNSNILVEYDNGANGAYWCSQVAAGHLNDLVVRIYGTQGSLIWHQEEPDTLLYTKRNQAPQRLTRGGSYNDVPAGKTNRLPTGHGEGLYSAFANVYQSYVDALQAKKEGLEIPTEFPNVEDGLNGVKFIHAVIDSAAVGSSWISLE